jgi:TRAP-type C4-dicarboxylate transport system substrate-binding protein
MPTIRVGGYAPPEATHSRAVAHFVERVGERTDGAVEVEVLGNILDTGRPAADLLSMTEAGELTWCYFSSSYLGSRVPELNALEVPFLFDGLQSAHAAVDGEFGAWLTAATERQTGLEVLGYWDNGFRHFTNRLRPVHRPEDVAGMVVRLQPNEIHRRMVEAWGAEGRLVDLSDGIRMITEGEVDAQENPLANTVAYGVDKVHGHVTMTGHLYGARGLYAHPATLEALPDDLGSEVRAAASEAIIFQRDAAAAYEGELRARLEGQGAEFVDLTADERAAFVAATADVIAAAKAEQPEDTPWPT